MDFAYLGESYFMPHEFLKQIKGVEVRRPVLDFDAAARKLQHTVFCVDDVPLAFTLKRSRFTMPIAMKKIGKNVMYALLRHAVRDKQAYHRKGHRA